MAKGLGVILAVTVAGRIAGMTADTIAAMAGQEVAARISAFRDNILILKLTDTDDLTKVIIAEAGAGTGTGEAETKIAEADKKSRQIRHLTMLC